MTNLLAGVDKVRKSDCRSLDADFITCSSCSSSDRVSEQSPSLADRLSCSLFPSPRRRPSSGGRALLGGSSGAARVSALLLAACLLLCAESGVGGAKADGVFQREDRQKDDDSHLKHAELLQQFLSALVKDLKVDRHSASSIERRTPSSNDIRDPYEDDEGGADVDVADRKLDLISQIRQRVNKRDDDEMVAMEELAVLCRHNPITCFGKRRRKRSATAAGRVERTAALGNSPGLMALKTGQAVAEEI